MGIGYGYGYGYGHGHGYINQVNVVEIQVMMSGYEAASIQAAVLCRLVHWLVDVEVSRWVGGLIQFTM